MHYLVYIRYLCFVYEFKFKYKHPSTREKHKRAILNYMACNKDLALDQRDNVVRRS
jgi:hypothetical protein